ncbi:alpha/beta fold hydrolase [Paludibacterium sp.]|uniref:alpha/beta hydrolase n=1 Tax=Paludibacterium sp. TaxID=1917523 RepID=UPI0025DFB5C9|nr:alpha/beta fold hydrolase [Paludibacterium sp.]MBV8648755.1 alpha/beta fold hydrolase [Paludibacterium sp.]
MPLPPILPLPAKGYESAIELATATGLLRGTLMSPPSGLCAQVVLIIAGSGPTDRDGNNPLLPGNNDCLKMLANELAIAGIASVRYDKRGVGGSVRVDEAALTFDDFVQDAADWLALLRREGRFDQVIVAGHSEGSLIGMLAAERAAADGLVSIAGLAERASNVLRWQLAGKLPAALARRNVAILQALERGERVDDVPPGLMALYRPSVQPYLISWFKRVPAEVFARLAMPCLVLQGDADLQVGCDQAMALRAANPAADWAVIEGMNHVLKIVADDPQSNFAAYGDPNLPIAPGLVEALLRYLNALSR